MNACPLCSHYTCYCRTYDLRNWQRDQDGSRYNSWRAEDDYRTVENELCHRRAEGERREEEERAKEARQERRAEEMRAEARREQERAEEDYQEWQRNERDAESCDPTGEPTV